MYTSESGMKNGIESLMRTAPVASIDDLTAWSQKRVQKKTGRSRFFYGR